MPSTYRPHRTLLLLASLMAMLLALAWDRFGISVGDITRRCSEALLGSGLGWSASFVERLGEDYLTLGMVLGLIVLLLYGLLQVFGARGDGVVIRGGRTRSALKRLLTGRPSSLDETLSARRDTSSIDWHFDYGRASLLGPLRLGQWAFPVVGFIGTVIGVSGAVRKLPEAVRSGQIDEAALKAVLGDLHVAFDTTFAGLTAAIIMSLLLYWLDDQWDVNHAQVLLPPTTTALPPASLQPAVAATAPADPAS